MQTMNLVGSIVNNLPSTLAVYAILDIVHNFVNPGYTTACITNIATHIMASKLTLNAELAMTDQALQ